MKKLSGDQRGQVAEKIMEWGNLVFAGFVVGQFVSGLPLQVWLIGLGFFVAVGAYIAAINFMKGR